MSCWDRPVFSGGAKVVDVFVEGIDFARFCFRLFLSLGLTIKKSLLASLHLFGFTMVLSIYSVLVIIYIDYMLYIIEELLYFFGKFVDIFGVEVADGLTS